MQLSLKTRGIVFFIATLCAVILPITSAYSKEFTTSGEYAYMIDYDTGTVLYEKNAYKPMGPSSMTKLMTAYLAFDALKHNEIKLDDTMPVSVAAWKKGGSKMYVKEGDRVSVDDLLNGIVVSSGNDACIVLAEGLAGSEENFAEHMNSAGKAIGLQNSNFKNSTGWPDSEHIMTAQDLVILAKHIIDDFPEYYEKYFAREEFTYSKITQTNRNKLLFRDIGVDGFKTGYTQDNGYGIVISGQQDGRRVILAINGLDSVKNRANEAERLYMHGIRDFQTIALYAKDEKVANAQMWKGAAQTLPLMAREDISVLTKKVSRYDKDSHGLKLSVIYEGPLVAPIAEGTEVAELNISKDGEVVRTIPLYAGRNVAKAGFVEQARQSIIKHLSL